MPAFTLVTRTDNIAVLTFDLPREKVNKLSSPVLDELGLLLDELAADQRTAALVVMSGKPGNFIAGADIGEIRDITDAARGEELSRRGQAVMRKLEALPFPTVAAIHGACMGGGLELALACTVRVATSHPKTILGLPEVKIGIIPGFGGTQRLPRLIGLRYGLDMIVTGKSVNAEQAKQVGLVDEVTSPETLLDTAVSLARRNTGRTRPSGIRAKKHLYASLRERNALSRSLLYRKLKRDIDARTHGFYPAPLAALEAVKYGFACRYAAGYENEARAFGRLSVSGESKNLINVYYLNETLKKDAWPSPFDVTRAVIIESGSTDRCIVRLFAEKGIAVETIDWTPDAAGRPGIAEALDMGGVDLAVESTGENVEAKKAVLRTFEQSADRAAIFVSNTVSQSITGLAAASKRPEQVVGMHCFDALGNMPLVEVIRGKRTSSETVAAAATFFRKLSKLPVVVNDCPGSLVVRIIMPCLNEALRMLEEGSKIEEIDGALLGFGMPWGPFILLDELGIDKVLLASRSLHAVHGERMQTPELLERLYKERYLGKKIGKGFYRYERGQRSAVNRHASSMITKRKDGAGRPAEQEIVERTVFLMIKEATLCLAEGVIDRPDLVDAALVFGIGFPSFRGGLLRYAESLGAKHIVERLDAYKLKYGERFSTPQSLFEMSRDDFISQVVG